MLPLFDGLRAITFGSVLFRFALAVLCGSAIGIERSYKNRAAGFRTHILICMGGSIAAMTGLYLYLNAHISTDVARLGAQVVSGLGFIGAGTIIVTKDHAIRGLNTAAGLWATGITGLALGMGFYEGGLAAAALILLTETVFYRMGKRVAGTSDFQMVVRFHSKLALDVVMRYCKDQKLAITDLHVTGSGDAGDAVYYAVLSLHPRRSVNREAVLEHVREIGGILEAEIVKKEANAVPM